MFKNVLTWVIAISLAIMSGSAALGSIIKTRSPELALSLIPTNGFAAEAMASDLTTKFVAKNQGIFPDLIDPTWGAIALEAFQSEAVSPDAIAVIALSRTGDVRRELMQKAFELSRRQKIVTGWLIVDSGRRNQLPVLLDLYDALLRTSSSAGAVVIPMMAESLVDARVIAPLTELLSKTPPWAGSFWGQVAFTPQALANAVQLRKGLYRPDESVEGSSDAALIGALVANKQFAGAEELYNLVSRRPLENSLIKNGSFLHEPKYPPLDWQLFFNGEYGAEITNGYLQISAVANSGGLFARQLVRLPSEVLQLGTKFAGEVPDDANLEIRISCAETIANPPLTARLPLINRTGKHQISNQSSGCSYFWLDVVGRASDNGDGFDTLLHSISISPE